MSNNFDTPNQYELVKLEIDGEDVSTFFVSLAIYENIFIPAVTGSIILLDTDGGSFLEKSKIEYTEDINFTFRNAKQETLEFEGHLTGLRNEGSKDSKKMYIIDFASKSVRKNEEEFVVKRFKDMAPQDIVSEMLKDKLDAEPKDLKGEGLPMNFLGSRRKPIDIIKYVCTHGVSQAGKASATNSKGRWEEKSKGTTGFLCWETLDGYRFGDLQQLIKGEMGEKHENYKRDLANNTVDMETAMKGIIDYSFPRLGDQQGKARSGGYRNINVSLDMDTGEYKEVTYEDEEQMTDKQKEAFKKPTRIMNRVYTNERYQNECEKAKPDSGDQSRKFLSQNVVGQNTFDDQLGEFTLPPQYKMRAGDTIEVKMLKVQSEKTGGYDKKHSGNYVIKGIAHHIGRDGAYTKISTIRSSKQQDDSTSQ